MLKNSIVGSPTRGAGVDCEFFKADSRGHNIFSDPSCVQTVSGGDLVVPDLTLGLLANNGGSTPTHALLSGSPAIDAIPLADCITIAGVALSRDQRGLPRPFSSGCDIGAYEFQGPLTPIMSTWHADGDATDSTGQNNGTLINDTGFGSGVSGQAFSFDGLDDRVVVPSSASLNFGTGDFTVSFFAKFNDLQNNGNGLIHKDTFGVENAYRGWLFNICDNCAGSPGIGIETRNIGQGIDNNARYPTSNFSTGRWYNIAAVRQSNVLYLYIDGVLRATVPESSPTDLSNSADLEFGSLSSGSRQYFWGEMDEIKIFDRSLSAGEISDLSGIDPTPPIVTPSVTGTLGNDGWYIGDVNVSWSVVDGESSISSSTGCASGSVTSDTAGVIFTCSATSGGGTGTQSVTIKRDAAAPNVLCGASDNLWHSGDISIACSASDATSGLGVPVNASFSLATSVAAGTETANAPTNSRQVCDAAGNCSTAGPVSGNKIDKKAPVITITAPTSGSYLLNQAVTVNYSCSDGGSGVANCSGTTVNGGQLNTAAPGNLAFTVNAADNAGNAASPVTVNYAVNYGMVVLFDQTKASKSGSTVPVKIRLVDANGANVSSSTNVVHAVSVVQTSSQAATTLDDSGDSNPDLDFRYDAATGGYIFNLKTTGYGTGSYLLNFVVGSSPTIYSVAFQVRQ